MRIADCGLGGARRFARAEPQRELSLNPGLKWNETLTVWKDWRCGMLLEQRGCASCAESRGSGAIAIRFAAAGVVAFAQVHAQQLPTACLFGTRSK